MEHLNSYEDLSSFIRVTHETWHAFWARRLSILLFLVPRIVGDPYIGRAMALLRVAELTNENPGSVTPFKIMHHADLYEKGAFRPLAGDEGLRLRRLDMMMDGVVDRYRVRGDAEISRCKSPTMREYEQSIKRMFYLFELFTVALRFRPGFPLVFHHDEVRKGTVVMGRQWNANPLGKIYNYVFYTYREVLDGVDRRISKTIIDMQYENVQGKRRVSHHHHHQQQQRQRRQPLAILDQQHQQQQPPNEPHPVDDTEPLDVLQQQQQLPNEPHPADDTEPLDVLQQQQQPPNVPHPADDDTEPPPPEHSILPSFERETFITVLVAFGLEAMHEILSWDGDRVLAFIRHNYMPIMACIHDLIPPPTFPWPAGTHTTMVNDLTWHDPPLTWGQIARLRAKFGVLRSRVCDSVTMPTSVAIPVVG
ncbi:hypothetical protein QBC33DRAFT_562779 [Phialemonium atrogriseum]|uniref:Uncharacterized protein n=1 Tax=Phialemonium atrogriseum TaxID=1093897 RepID=A0AAJ0BUT7_9PEZI|nr:uncharacterized protein QBC33DRAFT_562779 [Phialemonium atrogriseum]KAK1763447.1 hypothetical protein QBC33DRAFT_562779 [Phialemonium atrogriseum]